MFAPTAPPGKGCQFVVCELGDCSIYFCCRNVALLPFVRCLAASSGTQGAKATTMANAAAICVRSLVQSFLR